MIVRQPLEAVQLMGKFDIKVRVDGAASPARPARSATASPVR